MEVLGGILLNLSVGTQQSCILSWGCWLGSLQFGSAVGRKPCALSLCQACRVRAVGSALSLPAAVRECSPCSGSPAQEEYCRPSWRLAEAGCGLNSSPGRAGVQVAPPAMLWCPIGSFTGLTVAMRLCRLSAQVLQSFKIMDYSLLVAIHNMDLAQREHAMADGTSQADTRRPAAQKALYSTAMESIQGEARRGGTIETDDQ